jgi:uncharacterized membrane protein HdeD (DUF308 family)
MSSLRWMLGLVIGVILVGLGLFIAVRPLLTHNAVLTSARWLDLTFAVVFMLRGVINIRTAMARRRSMGASA